MRLFLSSKLSVDLEITLTEHFHHLVRVRRAEIGEGLECVDTTEQVWEAQLVRIDDESYTIKVLKPLELKDALPVLGVAFGNIKPARIAVLIEKCTEIGVRRFYPLITERTQHQYCDIERMARIGVGAAQQSRQLRVPEVYKVQKLSALNVDSSWGIAVPGARGIVDQEVHNIMIGPEGGWSKQEIAWCVERGVRVIGLGPSVLRTETACIVGAALLAAQHYS
jgi:16S rRNA (uracil1498-N3)-methyltransferase